MRIGFLRCSRILIRAALPVCCFVPSTRTSTMLPEQETRKRKNHPSETSESSNARHSKQLRKSDEKRGPDNLGSDTRSAPQTEQDGKAQHAYPFQNPAAKNEGSEYVSPGVTPASINHDPRIYSNMGPSTRQSISSTEQTDGVSFVGPLRNATARDDWSTDAEPGPSIFSHATNTVIHNSVFQNVQTIESSSFMKDFVKHTMPGAAFNSSARDPPPRCHPDTRLASMKRAQDFLQAYDSECLRRLFWIVGPAGVGKSAIMQSVAESIPGLKATVFFSVNVRDDPLKVLPTIAFQIAAQHEPYCAYIGKKLTKDPTLPETSLETQFRHFIEEAFLSGTIFTETLPILIDGLDECRDAAALCRLLDLIVTFISERPSPQLMWIVASRPEPHITTFFENKKHLGVYQEEKIEIESVEACSDVERHLRAEFERIRMQHAALSFLPQWPKEKDFLLLAAAAKGLFAYSSTAINFINDVEYGDPESQLQFLILAIKCAGQDDKRDSNPMAQLHALYDHIINRIPAMNLHTTRKILAMELWFPHTEIRSLATTCDWLGVHLTNAYGALRFLHSVLNIPLPKNGETVGVQAYHKSFIDYLIKRFPGIQNKRLDYDQACSFRILEQISKKPVETMWDARNQIELSWPRTDESSRSFARMILHQHASRFFVTIMDGNQIFMADDPMSVRFLRVMDPDSGYEGCRTWLMACFDGDDIMLLPLPHPENNFLVPIAELSRKYFDNPVRLDYSFFSKNPLTKDRTEPNTLPLTGPIEPSLAGFIESTTVFQVGDHVHVRNVSGKS
ncbi:hypothetical protein D9756_010394 [Leucocoprinus leucothites]|uniref:NACHT domain-containing protein n=1 Tax=Leucocoprinus leucothites TaxID=201217 RepID=A0A8H5CRH5_9AGAR|nr:hypothetical protein D9756_010394 [Leucoagaricus leucothites]